MKNLYASLGYDRIIEDPEELAKALVRSSPGNPDAERARLVLGNPVRKAHYDWTFACALKLARSRQRLGLQADPFLPRPVEWGPPPLLTTAPRRQDRNPVPWAIALGLGVLAVSWVVFRMAATPEALPTQAPKAVAPASAAAAPSPDAPGSSTPVRHANAPSNGGQAETHNPEQPFPDLQQVPPPAHGTVELASNAELSIPWRITSTPGQDYFLVLSEAQTQRRVLTLYLHGGEPFLGAAPEGEFSLAYTSGFYWYGPHHRFGPGSRMLKAERTFRLVQEPDRPNTWELNLRPASGRDPLFTPADPDR